MGASMLSCHVSTVAGNRQTVKLYYALDYIGHSGSSTPPILHTGLLNTPMLDCGMTDNCSITLVFLLNFIFINLLFY